MRLRDGVNSRVSISRERPGDIEIYLHVSTCTDLNSVTLGNNSKRYYNIANCEIHCILQSPVVLMLMFVLIISPDLIHMYKVYAWISSYF